MTNLQSLAEECEWDDTFAQAYLGRADAPLRAQKWIRSALKTQALVFDLGRSPRRTSTPRPTLEERRAFEWLRSQRRATALSRFQLELLAEIPGFLLDPRDDRWMTRLAEVDTVVRTTGRLPTRRESSATDPLAQWLGRQRRAFGDGSMPYVRRSRWLAALARWAGTGHSD